MTTETLSYWQRTAAHVPLSTDLPSSVDVAIIGGGIIGAALCYWLTREGINVALLERNALAYGATGRNAGFVVAGPAEPYQDAIAHLGHETAQAATRLTYESQALLRCQVLEEEKIQCDYQEPGTVRLAVTERQLERLKGETEALQADSFSAHFIDREQVQIFIKTLISPRILGGLFLPNQGTVHSAKLVQGLVLAALRRGAQAYHAEVHKLASHSSRISIHTSSGTLTARIVIVATNIWASKLLPGLSDIIVPWREQMLAYAPAEPIFTAGMTADIVTAEYWRQTPDGTILIGGCGSVEEDKSFGTWESYPTEKVQNAIEQILPRLFPKLTQLHVVQRWSGLLDFTTDNFPIVDQVPDMPGVFMVAGFSGHGMPFGMKFGQLLATTVKNGAIPSELKPYRLDRPTLKKWEFSNSTKQKNPLNC